MTIPEPIQQVPAHPDNYTKTRLGYRVQGIIIHTIVGTLESADATFQNPNRMASAHYGIACDGSVIHQYVSEADIAWHCGRFYPDAGHPLGNANTIGIEHCDNGNYNGVRSDGLYKTSSDLVRDICHRYGIAINRTQIRKHREVSEQPTSCPDALDIDRIVTMAAGAPAPAPSTGDVDVLYVGPIHAFNASFKTFAAGASYPDPVAVTVMGQSLASGATVVVDAYSYSSAPVQSSDLGGGTPGLDHLFWRSAGRWIPDAILDTTTSSSAPKPGIPSGEKLGLYPGQQGPTGDKGPIGDKGPTGDKGPMGDSGTSSGGGGDAGHHVHTVFGAIVTSEEHPLPTVSTKS